MKTHSIIGLALGCLLLQAGEVSATEYEIVKIDPLGGRSGYALDINSAGQVVGYGAGLGPFLWTIEDGLSGLPLPPGATGGRASAINDNGWIVGSTSVPFVGGQATLWRPGHAPLVLDNLPGMAASYATELNNSGQVVGFADSLTGDRHAFFWTESDGIRDLGTLGGTHTVAGDINDAGVVVGKSTLADGHGHAFVWTEGDGISDLYPDWPLRGYNGIGINSAGDIVGQGEQPGDKMTPVLWPSDGSDPIFADVAYGWAEDINNHGMIVGKYRETSYLDPNRPFVWDGGDSLVMLPLVDVGGQTIAEAINDTGWVVGWGYDNGFEVPLVWIPEPATLGMLALGGLAMLRRKRC